MAEDVKLIITETGGDVDRTSWLYDASGQISYTLTQGQRGTAAIDLILSASNTYAPVEGWPVKFQTLTAGVWTTRFAATIDNVETKYIGDAGDRVTTLTLTSLEQVFDVLSVGPRAYFGKTAGYIVNDMLVNVCSGVPVTAGTISAGVTLAAVVYEDSEVVSDVFTALATASGYVWYVDPATQQLNFVTPTAVASPTVIVDGMIVWDNAQN